jgi:hypothetical protein
VTDRINADIAASNAAAPGGMSVSAPPALVSQTSTGLTTEQQAAIAAAYGGPQGQVSPGWITPQQYEEQAAAEELARRRGTATALPPALARVTPIPQSIPGYQASPPAAATGSPPPVAMSPESTAANPDDPGALAYLSAAYAQGSSQRVPERTPKIAEQYQQRAFGAMPGDVARPLPNMPNPQLDAPSPEQMGEPLYWPNTTNPVRARDGQGNATGEILYRGPDGKLEPQGARYQRLTVTNAAARPMTASQPSQFDQAQTAQQETENEALLNQRMALSDRAEQQDQAAREFELVGRGYADELNRQRRDDEARRVAIDKHVVEMDALVKKRMAEVNQNPVTKYWQDKGAWGKIGTAFAIGLGAMGQSLNGGQNAALEMVKLEIEGEVQRQRQVVDSLGTVIAAKRTILGDLLSKFRDPQAADMATRAILSAQVENLYRKQAAREASTELRASMNSLADALAMQREQARVAAIGGERATAYAWQPARTVGQVGGIDGLNLLAKKLQLSHEQNRRLNLAYVREGPRGAQAYLESIGANEDSGNNLPEDRNARDRVTDARDLEVRIPTNIGGGKGFAPKGYANELRKRFDAISTLQSVHDRLQKLGLNHSNLSPTDRKKVDANVQVAVGVLSQASGAGAPTGQEREVYSEAISASLNNWTGDTRELLSNFQNLIDYYKRPALEAISKDASGNAPFMSGPRRVK